jgi:hypothetical protein
VADFSHEIRGETHLRSGREELLEEIGLLREAGVTAIQVPPPRTSSVEQLLDWTEWFAAEIIPVFSERG